ncbi:MAG: acyltransferase family protein [Alphaproteobacteria bacterium]|nr:acyltransferase family protein [Alphaproteobacteria bacterium]
MSAPELFPRLLPRFRRIARAHDYGCVGFERIPEGPALLVGYHGSPALDAFLLAMLLYAERGQPPRGVGHQVLFRLPVTGRLVRGFGMLDGSEEAMARAVGEGELLLVLPGGTRECFRSSRTRYDLDWGRRQGYARLAQRHGLPILPFATSGVDELYRILGDGYRISKRLTGTDMLPLCLPIGHRGAPFLPPRPVPLLTRVGELIPPGESVDALDAAARTAVEGLLQDIRAGRVPPGPVTRLA